jgi:hypothetical protein
MFDPGPISCGICDGQSSTLTDIFPNIVKSAVSGTSGTKCLPDVSTARISECYTQYVS